MSGLIYFFLENLVFDWTYLEVEAFREDSLHLLAICS